MFGLVCDRAQSNQNFFDRKCGKNQFWFDHPLLSSKKVFCLFDYVHLLKNVRNSLINRGQNQFYDWDSQTEKKMAKWSDLADVYEKEKGSVLKRCPLKESVINPSSFERQRLDLVKAIIHEQTIAALLEDGFMATAEYLAIWKGTYFQ